MIKKFQLYCSCLTCRTETTAQNIKAHYRHKHTIKANCLFCNEALYTNNKFCSTKCAALIYNNARKEWTKIKTGPKKGFKPKNYAPWTKITQCPICSKWHPKYNTCSKECKSIRLSSKLKGRTGGNRDCSLPGIDSIGNRFYFDSH